MGIVQRNVGIAHIARIRRWIARKGRGRGNRAQIGDASARRASSARCAGGASRAGDGRICAGRACRADQSSWPCRTICPRWAGCPSRTRRPSGSSGACGAIYAGRSGRSGWTKARWTRRANISRRTSRAGRTSARWACSACRASRAGRADITLRTCGSRGSCGPRRACHADSAGRTRRASLQACDLLRGGAARNASLYDLNLFGAVEGYGDRQVGDLNVSCHLAAPSLALDPYYTASRGRCHQGLRVRSDRCRVPRSGHPEARLSAASRGPYHPA